MKGNKKSYLNQADASKHWEQRKSPALEYFELLKTLDQNPRGKKLLDVGCAEGIEVRYFQELGLRADGADISEAFIREAKTNIPNSSFIVASAESLPYKDSSYDIVFCINTLFYTDIEKSIPEFCRILKEGGWGIISFDTEIINMDDDEVFHSDSLEHLEKVLNQSNAQIKQISNEEERVDLKPFKHKHVFYKIIFQKSTAEK
jgi:ubiquinone/menaquinone biosynthesis C-methylase UbiE